jgi:hypothetical protein
VPSRIHCAGMVVKKYYKFIDVLLEVLVKLFVFKMLGK